MSEERETAFRVEMRDLASVLEGLNFPARRWQIIAWATYNGAGLQLVGALQSMPEGSYRGIEYVGRELNKTGVEGW
jgi:hypothetical protein